MEGRKMKVYNTMKTPLKETPKVFYNRKCTICDFVFDQDCDDCPAMPVMIKMWKDRAIIKQSALKEWRTKEPTE
jgi:hypothetical protein